MLVVDDEPRMIHFIRLNLEHDGYEVIEATSGTEALENLRDRMPDLILLDVMMPEMDGFETLQLLREILNRARDHVNRQGRGGGPGSRTRAGS